jgi:hypothetical protein
MQIILPALMVDEPRRAVRSRVAIAARTRRSRVQGITAVGRITAAAPCALSAAPMAVRLRAAIREAKAAALLAAQAMILAA